MTRAPSPVGAGKAGRTVHRVTFHRPQYPDPNYRYFHGPEAEGDAKQWVRELHGPPGARWVLERLVDSVGETIDRGRIE